MRVCEHDVQARSASVTRQCPMYDITR